MTDDKKIQISVKVPEDIHKKAKFIANMKGTSLNDYVLNLIETNIQNTDFNKLVKNGVMD